MNLLDAAIYKHNMSVFANWVDSTPVNQVIDSVTYDLYEDSNPFRHKFSKEEINNKGLRIAANTSAAVGAEVFSVFSNPYYLMHKAVQVPVLCSKVVNTYKQNSSKPV